MVLNTFYFKHSCLPVDAFTFSHTTINLEFGKHSESALRYQSMQTERMVASGAAVVEFKVQQ